jgi:nucleotide-binding universal stress UspA family protein
MSERIVVGVDGSDTARHAVEWAVVEAKHRNASVELVHVWSYPIPPIGDSVFGYETVAEAAEHAARAVLAAAKPFAERVGNVPISARLVQGEPGHALVVAAKGAALLVLGTRGRSPVANFVMGSVSRRCVHDAPCPVVVIPERWEPPAIEGDARPASAGAAR